MHWASGDEYEGEWRAGMMHGTGRFCYAEDGRRCMVGRQTTWTRQDEVSKWYQLVFLCQACEIFTGDIYDGMWQNDMRQGEGKCEYANKDVFVGNFVANFREGGIGCLYTANCAYARLCSLKYCRGMNTVEIGTMTRSMAMGNTLGRMGIAMRATGRTICGINMESVYTPTGTNTRANGATISVMVLGNWYGQMGIRMKESGEMIISLLGRRCLAHEIANLLDSMLTVFAGYSTTPKNEKAAES
eukprot:764352-Hanusia_phi.AAC.4